MQSANKGPLQKAGPWLRVGTLMLTTFGPSIRRMLPHLLAKEEESSQDKMSDKFSQELVKRGEYVKQELVKRGEQIKKELAEQRKAFWAALGFGLGLAVAGIVTFQLVRRRLLQEANEEPPIQLPFRPDPETSLPV
jgi:hypothetical protein